MNGFPVLILMNYLVIRKRKYYIIEKKDIYLPIVTFAKNMKQFPFESGYMY